MRIRPADIARSLVDTVEADPGIDATAACFEAFLLLRKRCAGTTPRAFVRLVEREVKRRGTAASAALFVPHEKSIEAETLEKLLADKAGKTVHVDRAVEPELIGGAVLFVEHRRLDSSIQGALQALLRSFLQPLE